MKYVILKCHIIGAILTKTESKKILMREVTCLHKQEFCLVWPSAINEIKTGKTGMAYG